MRMRGFGGGHDVVERTVRSTVTDVLCDAGGEEDRLLQHDSKLSPEVR